PVGVQGDVRVGALEFVEERLKGLLLGGVTHVEEAQLPGAIPGSTVAPGPASTSGEGTERREPEGSESPGPKYLAPLHRGRLTSTDTVHRNSLVLAGPRGSTDPQNRCAGHAGPSCRLEKRVIDYLIVAHNTRLAKEGTPARQGYATCAAAQSLRIPAVVRRKRPSAM